MNRIILAAACILACLVATPALPQVGRPSFRTTIDIVSLNVTVMDGTNRYIIDLEQPDFSVFEDGVKQEIVFFTRRPQPIALSLLLDSSASMEDKLETLQIAAANFVKRLKAERPGAGHRLRQPRLDPPAVHLEPGRARRRHPAGGLWWLHLAAQRDLHLAQGAREDPRAERRRRPAPGAHRLLGRRRHVEPGFLRRGARPGEAVRDVDLHDRAARH